MESIETVEKDTNNLKAIQFMMRLFVYLLIFIAGMTYNQYLFYKSTKYEVIHDFEGMTCFYKEPINRNYGK